MKIYAATFALSMFTFTSAHSAPLQPTWSGSVINGFKYTITCEFTQTDPMPMAGYSKNNCNMITISIPGNGNKVEKVSLPTQQCPTLVVEGRNQYRFAPPPGAKMNVLCWIPGHQGYVVNQKLSNGMAISAGGVGSHRKGEYLDHRR